MGDQRDEGYLLMFHSQLPNSISIMDMLINLCTTCRVTVCSCVLLGMLIYNILVCTRLLQVETETVLKGIS